jgi:NAD(P)H-dependent FMN reductase
MAAIAISVGSTRSGRRADRVARWLLDVAKQRDDASYDIVGLADFPLPHLDEPESASTGRYQHDHTRAWSNTVSGFDGYVL